MLSLQSGMVCYCLLWLVTACYGLLLPVTACYDLLLPATTCRCLPPPFTAYYHPPLKPINPHPLPDRSKILNSHEFGLHYFVRILIFYIKEF
jgi:hypothetical protein